MNEQPDESAPVPGEDTLDVLVMQITARSGPGIVLEPDEAAMFLVMSANEYWRHPCDDLHCEVCYEFVTIWKSVYSALDAVDRLAVENLLEAYNTRAPAFPWSLR